MLIPKDNIVVEVAEGTSTTYERNVEKVIEKLIPLCRCKCFPSLEGQLNHILENVEGYLDEKFAATMNDKYAPFACRYVGIVNGVVDVYTIDEVRNCTIITQDFSSYYKLSSVSEYLQGAASAKDAILTELDLQLRTAEDELESINIIIKLISDASN